MSGIYAGDKRTQFSIEKLKQEVDKKIGNIDLKNLETESITNSGQIITNSITSQTADFVSMLTISGAPIIESGSNADGSWIKWADGTMICRTKGLRSFGDAENRAYGTWTSSQVFLWTYPIAFVGEIPDISGCAYTGSYRSVFMNNSASLEAVSFRCVSGGAMTGAYAYITAIGRWK